MADKVPCGILLTDNYSTARRLGIERHLCKIDVEGSFSIDLDRREWRCGERDVDRTSVALCKRCQQALGLEW